MTGDVSIPLSRFRRTRWDTFRPWILWGSLALLVLGALHFGALWYTQGRLQKDADYLFEHILGDGRAEVAHREADTQFQICYPLEVFAEYLQRHPGLLQREQLTVRSVEWLRGKDGLYAVVRAQVAAPQEPVEITFYCRQGARGNWRLAGIGPDLRAAVPGKLEPVTAAERGRRN